jgi:hypothetical protein
MIKFVFLLLFITSANAQEWPNLPIVGGQAYSCGQNNGVSDCTVPAGPPSITGIETIPLDTNLSGGETPQTAKVTINTLAAYISNGASGLPNSVVVTNSPYNAVCDTDHNDQPNIQAAYDSFINPFHFGIGGTVIFPNLECLTRSTVTIGVNNGSGGRNPVFTNTQGQGSNVSGILGVMPNGTDPIVLMAENKYWKYDGMFISSANSPFRAGSCLMLGGNGGSYGGTETLASTISNSAFYNCQVGIAASGNSGASSEILYLNTQYYFNDTAWISNDFNTLDHLFVMASMSNNGIGFDSGASEGFSVIGGSGSQQTIADFQVGGNGHVNLYGWRSEASASVVTGQGGGLYMEGCRCNQSIAPNFYSITGSFSEVNLQTNQFDGYLHFTVPPNNTYLFNNLVRFPNNNLAFKFDGSGGAGVYRNYSKMNSDINSASAIPDFDGDLIGSLNASGSSGVTIYEPLIWMHREIDVRGVNLGSTFGVSYSALSHVRQLSEGSIPGAYGNPIGVPTPGLNLRVSGTFATSATLNFTFTRNVTVTSMGQATLEWVISGGTFLPTDVGKPFKIAGNGNSQQTDYYGYVLSYIDSTHILVQPAFPQFHPTNLTGVTATIGANEPDGNYIVVSAVGNAASPENYSITAQSASGFTAKSSNASSTATVNFLIVR